MKNIFDSKLSKALLVVESAKDKLVLIKIIDGICQRLQISMTVIGGMAVYEHGYKRNTNDIDLLVRVADIFKVADELVAIGLADIGHRKFEDTATGTIVELCTEGAKAGNSKFPAPEHDTPGAIIASLPLLLSMKVAAGRMKDRADYIELIKINKLPIDYIEKEVMPRLNTMDGKMALALWRKAQKEMAEE